VVVAVISVRVVEVAVDEVIDVVAVWHGLVAALGPVSVAGLVGVARVIGGAALGVAPADRDHVLVDMVSVGMVEMTIVQVVDMVLVPDRDVPAFRTVLVLVPLVDLVVAHRCSLVASSPTLATPQRDAKQPRMRRDLIEP
jgi:hypothetical protein